MARTGTSLTAGIFAKHGVWCGGCRSGTDLNPKGFYEHTRIKKLLKVSHGVDLRKVKEFKAGFREKVEEILESENYTEGPWLVKHSALYYKAWDEFNPIFVKVRRPTEAAYKANIRINLHRGRYDDKTIKEIIQLHNNVMDTIEGPEVYTQDVVHGDFSSIINALEYCGIEAKVDIIEDFVEPSYWHHDA